MRFLGLAILMAAALLDVGTPCSVAVATTPDETTAWPKSDFASSPATRNRVHYSSVTASTAFSQDGTRVAIASRGAERPHV